MAARSSRCCDSSGGSAIASEKPNSALSWRNVPCSISRASAVVTSESDSAWRSLSHMPRKAWRAPRCSQPEFSDDCSSLTSARMRSLESWFCVSRSRRDCTARGAALELGGVLLHAVEQVAHARAALAAQAAQLEQLLGVLAALVAQAGVD